MEAVGTPYYPQDCSGYTYHWPTTFVPDERLYKLLEEIRDALKELKK